MRMHVYIHISLWQVLEQLVEAKLETLPNHHILISNL